MSAPEPLPFVRPRRRPTTLDRNAVNVRFRLLLDCFRTGQMSLAELEAHMAEDPAFAAYVARIG